MPSATNFSVTDIGIRRAIIGHFLSRTLNLRTQTQPRFRTALSRDRDFAIAAHPQSFACDFPCVLPFRPGQPAPAFCEARYAL